MKREAGKVFLACAILLMGCDSVRSRESYKTPKSVASQISYHWNNAVSLGGNQWGVHIRVNPFPEPSKGLQQGWGYDDLANDDPYSRQDRFTDGLTDSLRIILSREQNKNCEISSVTPLMFGRVLSHYDVEVVPSGAYVVFRCPTGQALYTSFTPYDMSLPSRR